MFSLPFFRRAATVAAGFLIISGALAGCAAKQGIVGKWSTTSAGPSGNANAVIDFKQDGTDSISLKSSTMIGNQSHDVSFTTNGTYTVQGDTLNETTTSGSMSLVPGQPAQTMPVNPTHKTNTSKFKIDGDTLTLTTGNGGKPMTLTRVKG